jgi:hypothetical protein
MKKFLACMVILAAACTMDGEKEILRLKKDAAGIAMKYAEGNSATNERKEFNEGIVAIGDQKKMYVIDPSRILTGLIDDDEKPDAIVTLDVYRNGYQDVSEQLIMTSAGGKLRLSSTIESDMRILKLDGRKIIAEVPEHSRNSPLFNCPACREVVTFLYVKGTLVKSE